MSTRMGIHGCARCFLWIALWQNSWIKAVGERVSGTRLRMKASLIQMLNIDSLHSPAPMTRSLKETSCQQLILRLAKWSTYHWVVLASATSARPQCKLK
ncbi:hypothetical protein FB451DRAFT_439698 [Mycena latifolia]|nr:hypothetical protein FB451DRAFT_439698 [Mycena latifolia]